MRQLILNFLFALTNFILRLRYKFVMRNFDKVLEREACSRSGGVLFLCNHPALMDPVISFANLWSHFTPRPIAAEYVHETPILGTILNWMRGISVPDFDVSSNILKKQRAERSFRRIVQGLKDGDNFIINPAGRLKLTGTENLGGVSWVHRLVQEVPEANIVLIRIDGLWGSMFSRAPTGKSPPILKTFIKGGFILLKNLLFFAPKREIRVDFELTGEDFPRNASRVELNRYLEKWFNQYQASEIIADEVHEKPVRVSYSFWKEDLIELKPALVQDEREQIEVEQIPPGIRKAIVEKLAEITDLDPHAIKPNLNLSKDLGLDSLDGAELILFLSDRFGIKGVKLIELTTVAKLMAVAAGQIDLIVDEEEDEEHLEKLTRRWQETKKWRRLAPRPPLGKTIHEAFLHSCDRMGDAVASCDRLSGVLTYRQMKMRVLLLANEIKKLPGDRIGVMLPASTTVNIVIIACLLAGKTPVMINWTVGRKHLQSCIETAGTHVILTSRKFTDQLGDVDLTCAVPLLVYLEEFRKQIGIVQKLSAVLASYRKASAILEEWNAWYADPHSPAVVLFTSGTESKPKGVPLSHRNILSNHRATLAVVNIQESDVLYGMLPPFHSFGFTVTGILPLLCGIRVVYSPNPTDGIRLARGIDRWGISIVASAPSFLKGIIHAAEKQQLKSVRLFLSGAEKAPKDLFEMIADLGEGRQLLEGYGITECSPVITINRPDDPKIGVGRALPNLQLKIVDAQTHEAVSKGSQGLILVRGPSVFSGYLDPNNPSPFIEIKGKRWYSTGDLGSLDSHGNLIISGRLKRFVKIGGEMISLQSMEDVLNQLALSKLSEENHPKGPCLAIHPSEEGEGKTKMHLVSSIDIDLKEANESLRQAGLSNLARLSSVVKVNHIPLTGTGKIAFRELALAFEESKKDGKEHKEVEN